MGGTGLALVLLLEAGGAERVGSVGAVKVFTVSTQHWLILVVLRFHCLGCFSKVID